MTSGRRSAAFFDVDDTLVMVKTIFSFLQFYLRESGREAEYPSIRAAVRATAEGPGGRRAALREYAATYAGVSVVEAANLGVRWFQDQLAGGSLFDAGVLDRLRRHRSAGREIVLVSGSFPMCLRPIADHVGCDALVGSAPEEAEGYYTGGLEVAMVGRAKVTAVQRLVAERRIDPASSYGYGDHPSDLPLLEYVGHPVVVGEDPILLSCALERGWATLPAQPKVQSRSRVPVS